MGDEFLNKIEFSLWEIYGVLIYKNPGWLTFSSFLSVASISFPKLSFYQIEYQNGPGPQPPPPPPHTHKKNISLISSRYCFYNHTYICKKSSNNQHIHKSLNKFSTWKKCIKLKRSILISNPQTIQFHQTQRYKSHINHTWIYITKDI